MPVVGWDDDGNALILDHKAGKRVRANQEPTFISIGQRPGWGTAVPAAPGWTVRWCKEGKDDIVDPVVGFLEDPSVNGGCPILADLQMSLVHDLHEMLRYHRGYQPFLIPPPASHRLVAELPYGWKEIWQRGHMSDDGMTNPALAPPTRRQNHTEPGIQSETEIDFFINGVNTVAHQHGLAKIPPSHVRSHMFRKTMPQLTGDEPDLGVRLGLQLKHAARRAFANRTTQAYAQMDASRAKEFDTALQQAAARKLVNLLRGRRQGERAGGAYAVNTPQIRGTNVLSQVSVGRVRP